MTAEDRQVARESVITRFLRLIRFSHTIFALPFALASLIIAANGRPSLRVLGLVLVCMAFARTAAMLFNRLVDWTIDQQNPRTSRRHLLLSKSAVIAALVVSSVGFVAAAAQINRRTFTLAPVALTIVFFYSVTKRFTAATHFFLGLALGVAPIAAWIAQTGHVNVAPMVLAVGVICWVAGFDLIYATQDYEFDQLSGLRSLVVSLGVRRALRAAQLLHLITLLVLIAFGMVARLGSVYFTALGAIGVALIYEHRTVNNIDLAAINRAFFHSNAFVSAIFLVAVVLDRVITWH